MRNPPLTTSYEQASCLALQQAWWSKAPKAVCRSVPIWSCIAKDGAYPNGPKCSRNPSATGNVCPRVRNIPAGKRPTPETISATPCRTGSPSRCRCSGNARQSVIPERIACHAKCRAVRFFSSRHLGILGASNLLLTGVGNQTRAYSACFFCPFNAFASKKICSVYDPAGQIMPI